ncbi:hypothetical protein HII31_08898 [Pseudocercospora fuligena]|uniref:Uncharacterized protein n=1 Tax=Pseudocercospora fuligena TaxID=685502 RepID=A0A8H6RET5_9PEZI|nr:hypothetical protein HII31_08898 [Pseudocercospora fuligena]
MLSDDKIITSDDHELSAVQQERQPQSQQDAQTPMTRTSPSRRRVLSLISQALITPNHDLKILRQAIHETEIFLEYAKRGLGEEVRALNEGAVKNDSAKGKDGFTARHSSQRSRKASARAQEKKNEVHKSVDLVTSEAEHSTRQASQRGRKSSAKGPEKKDDVSETHGVSEDPYPGELIVPEELVPAGSISCASSHTRVTRAPTVASSSSTSISKSIHGGA